MATAMAVVTGPTGFATSTIAAFAALKKTGAVAAVAGVAKHKVPATALATPKALIATLAVIQPMVLYVVLKMRKQSDCSYRTRVM